VLPAPEPRRDIAGIWKLQPLDADKQPWRGMEPVDAECRELAAGELSFIRPPSEDTRLIELTATFPAGKPGHPMPYYSRVHFMGKPVMTMPTHGMGNDRGRDDHHRAEPADQLEIAQASMTIVIKLG
jgi:hypothetical protein